MADIKGYVDIIKTSTSGDNVRDAIINCMNAINQDSAFTVMDRNINGKVSELPSKIQAPAGVVYKTINLNITNDDGSETSSGVVAHDWEVNNNSENGQYTAESLFGPNTKFGTVNVNLDFSGQNNNIKDIITISTEDLEDDGSYDVPTKTGYAATKSIKFTNVNPVEAKGGTIGPNGIVQFEIDYWDTDASGNPTKKVYGPVTLDKGDTVDNREARSKCTNPGGLSFKGWKPATATQKGSVYAQWGDVSSGGGGIADSWSKIVANKGASYPVGATKTIDVVRAQIPYSAEKALYPFAPDTLIPDTGYYEISFSCEAVKVGNAVDIGTTSSWLTTQINFSSGTEVNGYPSHIEELFGSAYWPEILPNYHKDQYESNPRWDWLHKIFFKYVFPATIRKGIVPCTKSYRYANLETNSYINHEATYELWLPSFRELYIDDFDNEHGRFNTSQSYYDIYITPSTNDPHYMDELGFHGINGAIARKNLFMSSNGNAKYMATRDSSRISATSAEGGVQVMTTATVEDQQVSQLAWSSSMWNRGCCAGIGLLGFCL